MTQIIYPGTFDPITNGHIDLIARAARMFDKVVIAIAYSDKKKPMFNLEERIALCEASLADIPNTDVCGFNNLIVDVAREKAIPTVLRGVRSGTDFDFELQLANMNRAMKPDFETVFLTPADNLSYISSSLVREIATMHGDVSAFVHPAVQAALSEKTR